MLFLPQIAQIFLLLERVFEPLRELRKLRFDAFQAFFLPQITQICTDFLHWSGAENNSADLNSEDV